MIIGYWNLGIVWKLVIDNWLFSNLVPLTRYNLGMSNNNFLPPRGFRDIQPAEAQRRQEVIQTARQLAESFGFLPIETPTVEYRSTLMGKYGQEADKLIFDFTDRGGRQVALRYDQTVPLSRYVDRFRPALPFKRYQIQPSFRAEKPQKGRYREFIQIDFDIVGDASNISDAEILWLTAALFDKLGLSVTVYYNSRQLLYTLFREAGVPREEYLRVAQIIDKLDKIAVEEVQSQLQEMGLKVSVIKKLWRLFKKAQPTAELEKAIALVHPRVKAKFQFSPYLVRGLDYYTGLIFEVKTSNQNVSLAGGGRYDKLIKQGSDYLPSVGVGIGLDRLVEVLQEKEKKAADLEMVILVLDEKVFDYAFQVADILRRKEKKVLVYPNASKALKKGLKYALSLGAKEVVFLGPDEKKGEYLTIKDLDKKSEKQIKLSTL